MDNQVIRLNPAFDRDDLCASAFGEVAEGTVTAMEGWRSTAPVDVSAYYGLGYCLAARKPLQSIAFYDGDHRYLCGVGTHSISGIAEGAWINHISVTVVQGFIRRPQGAVYARFLTYDGPHDPMKDTAITAYVTEEAYNAAAVASGPLHGKKIVCLGDSLTEGDYGIKPCVANVHYRNYPFFLSRLTGATTVTYGRCGATSASYLQHLYKQGFVDVTDADGVILMLGSNLGLKDEGLANAYRELVTLIRGDMKAGASLFLVTPPHATENPEKSNYGYNGNVLTAVAFVRAYAAEQGLPLVDAYADSPIQTENENVYQAYDGLHMCEPGYEAFARFMADAVTERLR